MYESENELRYWKLAKVIKSADSDRWHNDTEGKDESFRPSFTKERMYFRQQAGNKLKDPFRPKSMGRHSLHEVGYYNNQTFSD